MFSFSMISVFVIPSSYDDFKFFHLFQFSSLIISRPKVFFIFPCDFQFFALYSRSFSVYLFFFFSDFIIFVVGGCFLFSMIFSFLLYIPSPYSDYFNFSTFFSFSHLYFIVLKCIYFSVIFSFSLIFQVLQCILFSFFLVIFIFFRRRMIFHFP